MSHQVLTQLYLYSELTGFSASETSVSFTILGSQTVAFEARVRP